MKKLDKNKLRVHRKKRIRAKVNGSAKCPRLAVFKSLKVIYAQAIDDENGKTIAQANSAELKAKNDVKGAEKVGEAIAKKCLDKKIEEVVFDRAGYKYHGKVKALADAARKAGLKF